MQRIGENKIQLNHDHSEKHCTPSGIFLGIESAVTYLWGTGLWIAEDDAAPEVSPCPRI